MAIPKDKGLGLDKDKLVNRTMSILGKRDGYFTDMLNALRKRFPGVRLVYANNQMGMKLDPDHPNPDYILIMKTETPANIPGGKKVVTMIDLPLIFSERSIAGWTMAVEDDNIDGFFEYLFDRVIRLDGPKFEQYIEHMCLLSLDEKNELYWKTPENADTLCRELMKLHSGPAQSKDKATMAANKDYSREAVQRRKKNQKPNP